MLSLLSHALSVPKTLPAPQLAALTSVIVITVDTERTCRESGGHWLVQIGDQDQIEHQLSPWITLGASWIKGSYPACSGHQVQTQDRRYLCWRVILTGWQRR